MRGVVGRFRPFPRAGSFRLGGWLAVGLILLIVGCGSSTMRTFVMGDDFRVNDR